MRIPISTPQQGATQTKLGGHQELTTINTTKRCSAPIAATAETIRIIQEGIKDAERATKKIA